MFGGIMVGNAAAVRRAEGPVVVVPRLQGRAGRESVPGILSYSGYKRGGLAAMFHSTASVASLQRFNPSSALKRLDIGSWKSLDSKLYRLRKEGANPPNESRLEFEPFSIRAWQASRNFGINLTENVRSGNW